jgi:hypothetical protein
VLHVLLSTRSRSIAVVVTLTNLYLSLGLRCFCTPCVAISSSNVVYFSNFGGADSLDYIGSVNIDNSNPQKLVALADLNGTIPYFLVKHLATNGATVYAAVYGGPCKLVFAGSRPAVYQERCAAGTSYILKCEDGTACAILVTIKDSMGSTWIPTAVAYSTSLSRVSARANCLHN